METNDSNVTKMENYQFRNKANSSRGSQASATPGPDQRGSEIGGCLAIPYFSAYLQVSGFEM